MDIYYNDDYSNYLDPWEVDHNPFNMLTMTEFYIYLFVGIMGLCVLIWAGYSQFWSKKNFELLYAIGLLATGASFVNISSIRLSETNFFVVAVLMFFHFIACSLIVEGSTRHFMLQDEKKRKKENDLKDQERIKNIMDKWREQS